MPQGPATSLALSHAACDYFAAWWLSRTEHSTQWTYATYLSRWTDVYAQRPPVNQVDT